MPPAGQRDHNGRSALAVRFYLGVYGSDRAPGVRRLKGAKSNHTILKEDLACDKDILIMVALLVIIYAGYRRSYPVKVFRIHADSIPYRGHFCSRAF